MNTPSSVIICPKCGVENENGSQNCISCHINLHWAFENLELIAEVTNLDNEVKTNTHIYYDGERKKQRQRLAITMVIGTIAGFIGVIARGVIPYRFGRLPIGFAVWLPCCPFYLLFVGIISVGIVYFLLYLIDKDRRVSLRVRYLLCAIVGFIAGFLTIYDAYFLP